MTTQNVHNAITHIFVMVQTYKIANRNLRKKQKKVLVTNLKAF